MDVNNHHMIMENTEVSVLRWRDRNLQQPNRKEELASDFFQKKAYFVIPQMKELQREKTAFKKQLTIKEGDQIFTRFRVVNGGRDIAQSNNIYYVSNVVK